MKLDDLERALRANDRTRSRFGGNGRFGDRLDVGRVAEDAVAAWAQGEGFTIIDLAGTKPKAGGPPTIDTAAGRMTAPDLALVRRGRVHFFEVKRRAAPTLHRVTGDLVTGIERAVFDGYLRLAATTGTFVYLGFVHDREAPGLLGGDVAGLADGVHHEAAGMVFWAIGDMPVLATPEALAAASLP